jgi:nucleoside 2-deoxyribosyltransferase
MPRDYLIGSLRIPIVPVVAGLLRAEGYDVFDDWFSAGPEADDHWMAYEKQRGHTYDVALRGHAARNVFNFDLRNLETSDAAVLVTPAGKSGHMELGFMLGRRKPGFVFFDGEPDRWDVMYQFANGVYFDFGKLKKSMAITFQHQAILGAP